MSRMRVRTGVTPQEVWGWLIVLIRYVADEGPDPPLTERSGQSDRYVLIRYVADEGPDPHRQN